MKTFLCLTAALFTVACAPIKTLDELEAEALQSGDWTLVEQRERLIAKRNARRPPSCPTGQLSYCEKNIGILKCQCLSQAAADDVFASR
ncbi:MAG: hypothetical protein AAGE85_06435 [Pseudomonadota bacterium]